MESMEIFTEILEDFKQSDLESLKVEMPGIRLSLKRRSDLQNTLQYLKSRIILFSSSCRLIASSCRSCTLERILSIAELRESSSPSSIGARF